MIGNVLSWRLLTAWNSTPMDPSSSKKMDLLVINSVDRRNFLNFGKDRAASATNWWYRGYLLLKSASFSIDFPILSMSSKLMVNVAMILFFLHLSLLKSVSHSLRLTLSHGRFALHSNGFKLSSHFTWIMIPRMYPILDNAVNALEYTVRHKIIP